LLCSAFLRGLIAFETRLSVFTLLALVYALDAFLAFSSSDALSGSFGATFAFSDSMQLLNDEELPIL
jgi:hypothetical protein